MSRNMIFELHNGTKTRLQNHLELRKLVEEVVLVFTENRKLPEEIKEPLLAVENQNRKSYDREEKGVVQYRGNQEASKRTQFGPEWKVHTA